jgi:hypothetical protein
MHDPNFEEAPDMSELAWQAEDYDLLEPPLTEEEIEDAVACYKLMDKLDARSSHWSVRSVQVSQGTYMYLGDIFLRENESHPDMFKVVEPFTAWLSFEGSKRREVLVKMVRALDEIVVDIHVI